MNITRKNTHKIRIYSDTSALLVIDMQKGFFERGPFELLGASKIIPGVKRLISRCRSVGTKIVFTRVYHDDMRKGIYPLLFPSHFRKGKPRLNRSASIFQIIDELKPEPNDIIIDKSRYSAFFKTKLESILHKSSIDTLLIVGVATNVCCESTVRDAFFRNFRVIVLSDLNATYSRQAHNASLENIRNCFGIVGKSSEVEKMLQIRSHS